MNLTKTMTKMCSDLREMGRFQGLVVVGAQTQSEESKLKDAANDGLTPKQTSDWINHYACINIHLDTEVDSFCDMHPYLSYEFDWASLEADFKEWLSPYLDGNLDWIQGELNLSGGDTEIIKPEYQ